MKILVVCGESRSSCSVSFQPTKSTARSNFRSARGAVERMKPQSLYLRYSRCQNCDFTLRFSLDPFFGRIGLNRFERLKRFDQFQISAPAIDQNAELSGDASEAEWQDHSQQLSNGQSIVLQAERKERAQRPIVERWSQVLVNDWDNRFTFVECPYRSH